MHSKDPEVAAAYLQAWSEMQLSPPSKKRQKPGGDGTNTTPWKFNKATQAWLLRHAYSPTLVPKETFQVLLRYLEGLQGAARERAASEADAIVALRGAKLAEDADEDVAPAPLEEGADPA